MLNNNYDHSEQKVNEMDNIFLITQKATKGDKKMEDMMAKLIDMENKRRRYGVSNRNSRRKE